MESLPPICPTDGDHVESTNPRREGLCGRCGKPMPPPPPPPPVKEFLERAERHAGLDEPGYADRGWKRFQAAAVEYGESWRDRPIQDFPREVCEELVDAGTWMGLFAVRCPEEWAQAEALALAAEYARLEARTRRLWAEARAGFPD